MADTTEQAWQRGYEAGCNNSTIDANPYSRGSRLGDAWEDGWKDGNNPDREEQDREARNA